MVLPTLACYHSVHARNQDLPRGGVAKGWIRELHLRLNKHIDKEKKVRLGINKRWGQPDALAIAWRTQRGKALRRAKCSDRTRL